MLLDAAIGDLRGISDSKADMVGVCGFLCVHVCAYDGSHWFQVCEPHVLVVGHRMDVGMSWFGSLHPVGLEMDV